MAKTKDTSLLPQGILTHASTASGRRTIRRGFGFTPDDDLVYALGWPSLTWLVAGDVTKADLEDSSRFFKRNLYKVGPAPAQSIPRKLRGLFALRSNRDGLDRAIKDDSAILDDERARLFDFILTEQFGFVATFHLEALFGPHVVARELSTRVAKTPPKTWQESMFEVFGGTSLRALHFVLLRCDEDLAKEVRGALSDVHATLADKAEGSRALRSLDVAIHGRVGVERSGNTFNGLHHNDLIFAGDDPEWVRDKALEFLPTARSADRVAFAPRLAFLGGEDVLRAMADNIKGLHSTNREDLAVGLSRCQHAIVAEIMTSLGTTAAKRYLKERSAR